MDLREDAGRLLKALGETLNLENTLEFDAEDTCVVVLDDKLLFVMELDEELEAIVFNVIIGKLPQQNREGILYKMLSGNFYWHKTEGATLSIDEKSDVVALCYILPFPLEEDQVFEQVFSKLAYVSDYWADQLTLEEPQAGFTKKKV